MENKETIKKILKESVGKEITRFAVFDFDGTLIDTPLPEDGKKIWKEKTGTDWPNAGWWSKPESLDMKVFDMPVIPSVIEAYKQERSNPNTLVVMMTGRIKRLSVQVETILDSKGLTFDKYVYNMGGSTLHSKITSMDEILKEYPTIKSVQMFDDRVEHIDSFKTWGHNLKGISFNITLVEGNHHEPQ